jgi:DNA-binding transcriptional ArsR family regulator
MRDALDLTAVAGLIGDPTRARMLTALLGGKALTATELAADAHVGASTASAHLSKLARGGLVIVEKQGKHRYFRLAGAHIADVLENLMTVAQPRGPLPRTGPADPDLRRARVCYDHLAGEEGVWLFDALVERKILDAARGLEVSRDGVTKLSAFGIDVASLSSKSRRPLCRTCLDWSERRHHLGGALGAALLDRMLSLRWASRARESRTIRFTPEGARSFRRLFS